MQGTTGIAEQLAQLSALHANGLLDGAQFEAAKTQVLSGGGAFIPPPMTVAPGQQVPMAQA